MNKKEDEGLSNQLFELVNSLSSVDKKKIISILQKKAVIPISVFKTTKLSGLEIIVKFLKENERKSFKEISKILNRELSTLYNTYNKSKKKFEEPLDVSDYSITIPFDIFTDRKYAVLESIVSYLASEVKLSLKEIASLLGKSYNTIKTVLRRYKIKNES